MKLLVMSKLCCIWMELITPIVNSQRGISVMPYEGRHKAIVVRTIPISTQNTASQAYVFSIPDNFDPLVNMEESHRMWF